MQHKISTFAGTLVLGMSMAGASAAELACDTADENTVLLFNFGKGEVTTDKVTDLSGNGNNGTLLNAAATWEAGRKGEADQAVAFDTTAWTYLGVPKSESLSSPKGGLTIELWLKLKKARPAANGSGYLLLWKSPNGQDGYGLLLTKSGDQESLQFTVGNGQNQAGVSMASAIPLLGVDQWHHLAAVWDNGKLQLLVDGKLIAEDSDHYGRPEIGYKEMPQELIIGTRTGAVLDEIRISKIARKYAPKP
ncbi:MAG: LamG domain-containing protein [bacterium]